jgi:hypothetical protein
LGRDGESVGVVVDVLACALFDGVADDESVDGFAHPDAAIKANAKISTR